MPEKGFLLDRVSVDQMDYCWGLQRVSPEWYWHDFRLRLSHGRNHRSEQRLERRRYSGRSPTTSSPLNADQNAHIIIAILGKAPPKWQARPPDKLVTWILWGLNAHGTVACGSIPAIGDGGQVRPYATVQAAHQRAA